MEEQLKQCSSCELLKPLEQFEKRRSKCKTCIYKQRAEITAKKSLDEQNQFPKIEEEPEDFQLPPNIAKKMVEMSFGKSREKTEAFIAQDMLNDLAELSDTIALYKSLVTQTKVMKEKKEYASKIETATAKKMDIKLKLIKNFGFFTDLSKPVEDDPLYTPVHLFIVPECPQSSIVPNKFNPQEDEIQKQTGDEDGN